MRAETAADNAGACLYFGFAEDCILECSQTSGRRIGGERLRRAAEKALAAGTLSGPEERMGASVADLPRVWAYWVGQKVTLATTAEYQEVYSRKSHQNIGFQKIQRQFFERSRTVFPSSMTSAPVFFPERSQSLFLCLLPLYLKIHYAQSF